jgi:hypothetical protein
MSEKLFLSIVVDVAPAMLPTWLHCLEKQRLEYVHRFNEVNERPEFSRIPL